MKSLTTDVLGERYNILVGDRDEVELPKELGGQCAYFLKEIKVFDGMEDCSNVKEQELRTQQTVVHELFHAFVHETGLDLSEEDEERLAVWYSKQWRRLNNSIIGVLDELDIIDVM